MDLDRLNKLVRLANNNSNEHEANLAARMVCKMLDGNIAALKPAAPRQNAYQQGYHPRYGGTWDDPFGEMMRQYAEAQKRAQAEYEKQKQQTQEDHHRNTVIFWCRKCGAKNEVPKTAMGWMDMQVGTCHQCGWSVRL